MKKFIAASALLFGLIIVAVLSVATYSQPSATQLFFDDFGGPLGSPGGELSSGWNVENNGGNYRVDNGTLWLGTATNALIAVYREFVPPNGNFTISACMVAPERLYSSGAFALRIHAGPLPIVGSTLGAQLEHESTGDQGYFVAVWNDKRATFGPSDVLSFHMGEFWFVLEMKVQRDPFVIVYNAYSGSKLLGTFTVTDPAFSYNDIRYICLEAWQGGMTRIDWIKISTSQNVLTPPVLTVSLSSSTSIVGFKVEMKGNLTYNNKGISGAQVLLSYSVTDGATWNEISSVNTAPDGSFTVVWMPSATGNYLVRASWAGDSKYPGANSTVSLAVTPFQEQNVVFSVTSNSNISQLFFNSTSRGLSFVVSGPSGTTGYVNVYIDKSLIEDISTLTVYFDGNQLDYTASPTDDSWLVHFTYQHSTHKVVVSLGPTSTTPTTPTPTTPTPTTRFIETPLGIAAISGIVAVLIVGIFIALRRRAKTPSTVGRKVSDILRLR